MNEMSREEINIRRLLARCELMAKDDPNKDWKLEKVERMLKPSYLY